MGNNSNKNSTNEDHIEHQRLGPVKLQQKPVGVYPQEEEDSFFMYLTRSVQSQKVYNDWVKSIVQIKDSQVMQILLLPQKHSFETVGLCGSGGVVKLTYDYYQFVLKTEIFNRKKLQKNFLQTQIWYLLFNIVRASKKFERKKRKIGNVHPSNILINESGQIKLISTSSLPGEQNNYDYLIQNQTNPDVCVYLAPEQMNADLLQKGTYPAHVDPCLAEVFSIGLTILASGTLEDCDKIYQRQPYKLNSDRLNYYLKQFSQKYSPFLYQTILSMVALNPTLRKKSSQIYRILSEYEVQIMDLQPFQVQNNRPPRSINQGYAHQQQIPNNYRQQIVDQIPQQPIYYNTPPPNYVQAPSNVINNPGQRGQPLNYRQ